MTQPDLFQMPPPATWFLDDIIKPDARFYPTTPGHKRRGTSQEAAQAIEPAAKVLRARVLQKLRGGAFTADEVAFALKESILSVRPRLSELRALGQIQATGERRQNESGRAAMVWRAT